MATKKRKKPVARKESQKPDTAKRPAPKKKTGATRRRTQKKVGKPAELKLVELKTPEKAADWLFEAGRSELAGGRTLRLTKDVELDLKAYPKIEKLCRPHAAALAKYGVPPMMVAGAGIIRTRLAAAERPAEEGDVAPASSELADAASLVTLRRGSLLRVLKGSRNAEARKAFGIPVPVQTNSPASVQAACKSLLSGKAKRKGTPAAAQISDDDVVALRAHVKALQAMQDRVEAVEEEGTEQTTDRDILIAALEYFYDLYGGAISSVLTSSLARVRALKLIPRREELRATEESEGGAGTGDGTGAGTAAELPTELPAASK